MIAFWPANNNFRASLELARNGSRLDFYFKFYLDLIGGFSGEPALLAAERPAGGRGSLLTWPSQGGHLARAAFCQALGGSFSADVNEQSGHTSSLQR